MKTFLDVFVDESIHVRGDFIVVAAVCSHADVQQEVVRALLDCGFDPARDEFKSSMRMSGNPAAQELRQRLQIILSDCKIGVAVCPTSERAKIMTHVTALLSNLDIPPGTHLATVHLDGGIRPTKAKMPADATVRLGCDSRLVAGIQLADCAAHLISTIILEELGLISRPWRQAPFMKSRRGISHWPGPSGRPYVTHSQVGNWSGKVTSTAYQSR